MRLIRAIVSAFTMKREEFSFTDVVSGEPVYNWRDGYGTRWIAGYWYLPGCFRVKRSGQEITA